MVLTVNSYGITLRKKDDCIEAESKEGRQYFPPGDIEMITLSAPCMLTSEVISLCAENDIPIMRCDRFGMPVWKAETILGGSVPQLRRRQLILSERPEGTKMVCSLLAAKLDSRITFLNKLASNRRDNRGTSLKEASQKINCIKEEIKETPGESLNMVRPRLLGLEGSAGRIYFSALETILPPDAKFSGRARGDEAGPFNQMLNYGYGILYQEMLRLCIQARLDPYIGVMHTDNYNRPTLVYDLVEPFRAEIESPVCKLFTQRKVHVSEHFQKEGSHIFLSNTGKKLLTAVLYHLHNSSDKMSRLVADLAKGLNGWEP